MYEIKKVKGTLRINFKRDFGLHAFRRAIHRITMMEEYPHTNDIWVIGKHHAHIKLNELETMAKEFLCHCPHNATRTKSAIVIEREMTLSIFKVWMNAVQKKVSFDLRIFHSLEEAEAWLGIAESELVP